MLNVVHDQAFGDFEFQPRGHLHVDSDQLFDLVDEITIAQLQR
ncbi:hypothetical protein IMCC9480_3557 [Oxalobacteraceae bacterium IMCC9480]|nr:hypothetical protein IMCC9480_3557 [Oxalobacteraceae bacterium IMCC9480]